MHNNRSGLTPPLRNTSDLPVSLRDSEANAEAAARWKSRTLLAENSTNGKCDSSYPFDNDFWTSGLEDMKPSAMAAYR